MLIHSHSLGTTCFGHVYVCFLSFTYKPFICLNTHQSPDFKKKVTPTNTLILLCFTCSCYRGENLPGLTEFCFFAELLSCLSAACNHYFCPQFASRNGKTPATELCPMSHRCSLLCIIVIFSRKAYNRSLPP